MPNLREFQKKIRVQDELRVGGIYKECERRGCDRAFLKRFDTRIWLFPEEQAAAFLSMQKNPSTDHERLAEQVKQYRVFLEVLIEKKTNHEKVSNWKKALQVIDDAH